MNTPKTGEEAEEATTARNAKDFKPYVEAEKVDKHIDKTLVDHPITKDNIHLWTLYHRTIQSSLDIIEKKIEEAVSDAST